MVDRAGELGGRVDRGSRRAGACRDRPRRARQGQLADRRRRQPAHGVAEERDAHLDRQRQEHEAPVEASVRQPAAPDAQPLSAPHRHRRDDRAGAEGHRGRRRRLRQHLRRRRRDRHAALGAEVRQHVRRTAGRPRRRRAVPRRIDRDAGHRADRHRRQVPRLRRVLGRAAAHARRGDRDRRRAARAISPAQRQALRAEPLEGRHLHDDGAGLRRESERVLRLRPGDEESRSVPARQRRPLAAHRSVDRQGRDGLRRLRRRRLLSRAADLRPVDHRREAEPADQGARVEGLVHAVERLLAAQARPRHERHRAGLRLQGQGVPRSSRARSAACGCSTRARSAARIIARRSIARRSSATRTSTSPRPARGARSRRGKKPTARAGSSSRSGARSTRSSPRPSSTATSSAAAWPPSRWRTRPAKWC